MKMQRAAGRHTRQNEPGGFVGAEKRAKRYRFIGALIPQLVDIARQIDVIGGGRLRHSVHGKGDGYLRAAVDTRHDLIAASVGC